jgi:hypothetical protein
MSGYFGVHSGGASVVAVVVTYNRRTLLARCIAALRAQEGGLERILVLDNASTDGTGAMLEAAAREPGIPLDVLRSSRNLGGAGGFAEGMAAAFAAGANWLWLMDDDSEPEPAALPQLLEAAARVRSQGRATIGFLASLVLWRDGTRHRMNAPGRVSRRALAPAPEGLVAVDYASFVSILVSREAVVACGLPIAEFFIGSDDVEYTWRLTKAGFVGYEVSASRVRHLTVRNAGMTLWDLQVTSADVETWAIKIRNLVAVNRRRPFGRLREVLRLVLLDLVWRQRGMDPRLRRRLVKAAREGLTWKYERLIRRLAESGERVDAHPRHSA